MKKEIRIDSTHKAFAEVKSCVSNSSSSSVQSGAKVVSFLPEVIRNEYSVRVTEGNINFLKKNLPLASAVARKLEVGCVCRPIVLNNGKTGALTVWPEGRAAISYFLGPILSIPSILPTRPLLSARTYWCTMQMAHNSEPVFVADRKANARLAKAFDRHGRLLPGPLAFPEKNSPHSFFSWKAKDKTFGVTLATGKASIKIGDMILEAQWDMGSHHIVLSDLSTEMRFDQQGSIVDEDGTVLVPASRSSRVLDHLKGVSTPAAQKNPAIISPILVN